MRCLDPELLVQKIGLDLRVVQDLLLPDLRLIVRWSDRATIITRSDMVPAAPVRLHQGDVEKIGSTMTGRRVCSLGAQLRNVFGLELDDINDTDLSRQISEALKVADIVGLRSGEQRAKVHDNVCCHGPRHASRPADSQPVAPII